MVYSGDNCISSPNVNNYLKWQSGCFGCCVKRTPIIAVDEPAKGLRIRGRAVRKPSLSDDDDFWSSTTFDVENSTFQSQRSISSVSTATLNHSSTVGSTSSNPEFINQGLLLWNENRVQWIRNASSNSETKKKPEHRLSWNAKYETVLGNRSRFPQPIPLSEIIEFLVEAWEQEAMDGHN